jgi:predicted permease
MGQIAVCLLLLIGAGLCGRSFAELLTLNPGFNTRSLIVVPLQAKGLSEESAGRFYQDLAQRVEALPGVRSVSYTRFSPLLDSGGASFPAKRIDGYTPQKDEFINVQFAEVGPDYFETMGIPIIQAPEADWPENATLCWVNESFAKRYWPGQAPLGKRVGPYMVNGVVKDSQIRNLTEQPGPFLYSQTKQIRATSVTLVVRTEGDAKTAMSSVRHEILKSNPDLDLTRMQTMREALARSLGKERFLLAVLGGFALTATLLAGLGIYGVMWHSVTQRTREIGIRMAVGAQRRNVLALVLKQGVLLTAIGTVFGLLGALAATRVLASVLYGVSPTDVATFMLVSFLLGGVAFIACLLPARRAARVDPMEALRYE